MNTGLRTREAARALNISPPNLPDKLRKMGLEPCGQDGRTYLWDHTAVMEIAGVTQFPVDISKRPKTKPGPASQFSITGDPVGEPKPVNLAAHEQRIADAREVIAERLSRVRELRERTGMPIGGDYGAYTQVFEKQREERDG